MKARTINILLVASAALSAVPAFADECGAVAPVSHDARAAHAAHAKTAHDAPDAATSAVGGGDAYKTQSGKREERDSIDAWFRGG
ncbi:hypothetical protein NOV72_02832 [Caballeronia novacaledonica]|uniref:Lipoprotein n=1 Tax=Caballeronia novacaledonica TaxID=1544861 RepID=A0A2U3I619_9BURK|nr:hypothetical protein [Caballeronia novacaledonica]SPB15612.1 hypothetical protein NOV72_02832 [Caballeronia novacaledonica]